MWWCFPLCGRWVTCSPNRTMFFAHSHIVNKYLLSSICARVCEMFEVYQWTKHKIPRNSYSISNRKDAYYNNIDNIEMNISVQGKPPWEDDFSANLKEMKEPCGYVGKALQMAGTSRMKGRISW